MENKINIAELLKDCPTGMELECPLFECIEFDSIVDNEYFPIRCRIKNSNDEYNFYNFTKYGYWNNDYKAKCIIFPKGKTTWKGFVPPCKFKDGDIISDALGTCIFKREGRFKGTIDYYCGIHTEYFMVKDNKRNPEGHYGWINDYRLATEEEKERLFQAIKDNGYKWNAETKTLEKLVTIFKVGDKIKLKNEYAKKYNDFNTRKITEIRHSHYILDDERAMPLSNQYLYELVPNKFDIIKDEGFVTFEKSPQEFSSKINVWKTIDDSPTFTNDSSPLIISSCYGHIVSEAHYYSRKSWEHHIESNRYREFKWAYESDLI